MNDYKKLYYILFNAITDAIAAQKQSNYGLALERLITAQQNTEAEFIKEPVASAATRAKRDAPLSGQPPR